MLMSTVRAVRRSLGFCLLLFALAPWVASAYTSVDTEALFPEQRSWHTAGQGWHGGLATHLTLFDEATAWLPDGEVSLDIDPGALMVARVGYDVGPLRFGQEVAWHRAPLSALSAEGLESGVAGEISQLKLLSRNRLALRFAPGSPHTAYVSLGLGASQAEIEFEDQATGLVYDDSHWAMVYEVLAGVVSRFANDDRLRIGIRATNAEPVNRVLADGWFNFRLIRSSPHRAYFGGSIGAVDSSAKDWSAGYQLGAGMGFQIADRTVLGVDYRYVAMPSFTAHTPGISIRYDF